MADYVPDRGDFIWLQFTPQAGREQAGHRPAIVLSPRSYNAKTNLALCCPITSHVKDYPFEVIIPSQPALTGVVLADQIKSLDWKMRKAQFIAKAGKHITEEVIKKAALLLG